MRAVKTLLALVLALSLLLSQAVAEKQVVITFLGDCTIGGEDRLMTKDYSFAKVAKREGYAYFFAKVRPLLLGDDLTVANFEGVLKADNDHKMNKTYCFRGLPAYAQILNLGSVEAVSLSNNHTGDYGQQGMDATEEALAAAGVKAFSSQKPYLFEKDGVTIGFIGFYAAGFYAKRNAITQAVQSLREQGADAVVCFVHAGQEYATLHNRAQILITKLLVDAGADLVIGSHPHVVQGTEIYKQRSVLYSIGNFVFGGNAEVRSNDTIIVRATLTFADDGTYQGQQLRIYPANISGDAVNNNYQPVLVQGDQALSVYARMDKDSQGQPGPETQTDTYREYAYLPAVDTTVAATGETVTASPTVTPGVTPVTTPAATATPVTTASATPIATAIPVITNSVTPFATLTATPGVTPLSTASHTAASNVRASATPLATATATHSVTYSATPTVTPAK